MLMPNINQIFANTNLVNTYSPKQKPDGLQVNFTFLTEKTKHFYRFIQSVGSFSFEWVQRLNNIMTYLKIQDSLKNNISNKNEIAFNVNLQSYCIKSACE